MNPIAKSMIKGAIGGLLTAVAADLDAFAKSPPEAKFDWKIALRRWSYGLVLGAATAGGFTNVGL